MSIRRLAYLLLAAFALLSMSAGVWQLADSRKKVLAVEWVQNANRLSDLAQRASAQLAMERGATATLLASADTAPLAMRDEILRIRSAVDLTYRRIAAHAATMTHRAPDHPLLDQLERLDRGQREIELFRARLDEQLQGIPHGLAAETWIALMSEQIEQLRSLGSIATLPLSGNDYTQASAPVIKDLLFTLSEHLGRERALVGVAIARGAALGERELEALEEYRTIALHARHRIEAIVEQMPQTAEIVLAHETYRTELLDRYEALRAQILASSSGGQAYPIDAEQWYRGATSGIDAVLGLTAAISAHFEREFGRLRTQAESTWALLCLIAFAMLVLLVVTLQVLRRKVLQPLRTLDGAAATISAGDLSHPLPPMPDDELGRLGRTFENMREALLADITRREQDARQLSRFKSLIERSASAMVVTSPGGIVEYVNASFETMTGYSPTESIGRMAGFWGAETGASPNRPSLWETLRQGRAWEGEFLNRRKTGELYWASANIAPVVNDDGHITHFIGIQNDISEQRRLQERLNFLLHYDELTVLPNRNLLELRFSAAREEAQSQGGQIAVITFGLSRFERINDSMGRDVGDRILREFASRLGQHTRRGDMVSRHGGIEFSMLATGLHASEDPHERLAPIMESLNLPFLIDGESLRLVVRAGLSVLPEHGESLDVLLRKATIALHHGERFGMDHCIYDEELDEDARERLALENALRRALEQNELELYYQPKVDMATGRLVGMEALARWQSRDTGEWISPAQFIPVAEESGLIQHLGAWALRQACLQNCAWQAAGLPPLVVAVNLSPAQLRQPDLPEVVSSVLAETGLDPALLELELTESALMDCPEQSNAALTRLKSLGLQLSIDDFGTGYSSLAYLGRFPVDQLKIDASFVQNATTDATAAAISTSVIALAHQMGLKVIAEGVETEDQLMFLHRHGCDAIQGYYYSRPVSAAAFAVLVASDKRLVFPDTRPAERTLLAVDDEPAVLAMISLALENEPMRVLTARSAREALELLASNEIHVILADDRMPEMSGTELLERVKSMYPDTVRIVLSGQADPGKILNIFNSGSVYKFFTKPWDAASLREQILDAFAYRDAQSRRSDSASAPGRGTKIAHRTNRQK